MQTIAPGITRVATSKSENSYLVDGADGITIIDAGRTTATAMLVRAAADLARPVARIVLTHAHPDHVQGAPALRAVRDGGRGEAWSEASPIAGSSR